MNPNNLNHFTYFDCHTHRFPTPSSDSLSLFVAPMNILQHPFMLESPFCLGVHPWDLPHIDFKKWCLQHQYLYKNSFCWGIGEIGIDHHKNKQLSMPDNYLNYFFDLSIHNKKPVILHLVKAYSDFLSFLHNHKSYESTPMLIHAFHASSEIIEKLLNYNIYFSLGPRELNRKSIDYKKSNLVFDKLLLETDDSNYSIKECYELAAVYFNKSTIDVQQKVKNNFRELFFNQGSF